MKGLLVLLYSSIAGLVIGQDSLKLSNTFKFQEGVYATFDALQRNQPTYTWDQIKEMTYVDREDYVAKFEYLKYFDIEQDSAIDLLQKDIWGVCIDGIPFIRMEDSLKQITQFVGLRTRGKICYYTYPTLKQVKVPMKIYDPDTGELVYIKSVINNEPDTIQKVLSFVDGSIADFKLDILKSWVKDDAQVANTLSDYRDLISEEKLYKLMLIYNDRNLVYLKEN